MLPVLSLDGILHLEVLENAITGEDFQQFVEGLLPRMNEWPLPNSVLVIVTIGTPPPHFSFYSILLSRYS